MSEMDESKPHLRSLIDGQLYELEGEMIVGRLAKCGIVIDQELGASREHARFSVVDQNVFVTDLGSLNGTLVNGKEIGTEAQLANGDILIFDVNKYEVLIPSAIAEPVIDLPTAEPEVDPNKTVFINRVEMRKRELSNQPSELTDDEDIEVEIPDTKYDAAVDRITPEISQQNTPENVESVAPPEPTLAPPEPTPAPPEPVPAPPEPTPAPPEPVPAPPEPVPAPPEPVPAPPEPVPAPPEPVPAPPEPNLAPPEPALAPPEPALAPPEPDASAEAIHRPGSWMVSADVSNSDRTVLAPGVVAMNAKPAQVDLTSISEPTIVVQTGENADTLLPLIGERTEWSIGSSDDRNLRITHSGVSGNHAAIVREGSKWKVIDQMSINGTFVNGSRVNIRFINNDDLLRFGPVECRFVVPEGFVGSGKSNKNSGTRSLFWKIALPVAILLIAGGGYYAYSTGMFPSVATPPPTDTQ